MGRRLRNVTITLDEEAARWARIEAARRDTSVSQLVAQLLREKMIGSDEYEAARRRYFAGEPKVHRALGARYPARDELHERDRLR
ncbi:MAG: hypothetical protein ACRELT_09155 [Longimicrobiales bacterium]